MTVDIYWFSGTGDSLAVARDIADKTGGRLIRIASRMDRDRIRRPWVKNHCGDQSFYFLQYAWIDQDLKQEMAVRR